MLFLKIARVSVVLSTVLQLPQEESSSQLCSGVTELLTKGKVSCTHLIEGIDEAISELDKEMIDTTDSMKRSCDTLSSDLDTTNNHVVSALTNLKSQLSSWLGEVDECIKTTMNLSHQQKTVSEELLKEMDNSRSEMHEMRAKVLEVEAERTKENASQHIAFKEAIVHAFETYEAELTRTMEKGNKDLEAHVKHINTSVGEALAKMLSDTISIKESVRAKASTFSNKTQDLVECSFSNLVQVDEIKANQQMKCLSDIMETSRSQMENVTNTMCAVGNKRKEMSDLLGNIGSAVATKKAKLDNATTDLVNDISAAVESAKEAIDKTSNTATNLLSNVQNANVDMQKSTSECINTFSSFMDSHGGEVCDGVRAHFDTLGASLADAGKKV